VDAIATPKRISRLERMTSPEADLPQILHLAEMLMQLVGQQRLGVLPELLEAGKLYRGMTKSNLTALVEGLQPQVDQLAEVLSLELTEDRDYVKVLLDAQQTMATLSEEIARENAAADDDRIYEVLLAQSGELTNAMRAFLAGKKSQADDVKTESHAAHYGQHVKRGFVGRGSDDSGGRPTLLKKLRSAATRCRERRQELSLLLIEPNVFDVHSDPLAEAAGEQTRKAVTAAAGAVDPEKALLVSHGKRGIAVIMLDCDRSGALELARQAIVEIEKQDDEIETEYTDMATTLSIGVATSSSVPKNFDAARVVESAMRCLSAARACGISAVKSIEV
jgi:GGDEF domain-containing protein